VDDPFEQRVRSFLGHVHEEFDVALFVRTEMEPATQALNDVVRGRGSVEQVQVCREVLQKLKIVWSVGFQNAAATPGENRVALHFSGCNVACVRIQKRRRGFPFRGCRPATICTAVQV
jgi:hypothetical protein